jgi:hypothetical protein
MYRLTNNGIGSIKKSGHLIGPGMKMNTINIHLISSKMNRIFLWKRTD